MEKYLNERIKELKYLIKLYEIISTNATRQQEYEEAIKTLFFYKGGLEELEALSEEFNIQMEVNNND